MLKIVFDTNIFVSALFWPGKCHQLYEKWLNGEFILATSPSLLDELMGVLKMKFNWSEEEMIELSNLISKFAKVVKPKGVIKVIKEDPADNKVLECAIKSKAEYIVSGDRHLLDLGKYKGTKVVSASEFIEVLGESKT